MISDGFETIRYHRRSSGAAAIAEAIAAARPGMHRRRWARLSDHPHTVSGGMRQRICIAQALGLESRIVIADEAVSALDVSTKAQVLDLQAEFGLSYLFISHDMSAVERVSHRIAAMFSGQVVETGPCQDVIRAPATPTRNAC